MDDLDGSARTRLRQDSEKLRQGGVQVEGSGARHKGCPHSGREPRMPPWSDPSQENSQEKIPQMYYCVCRIVTRKLDFVRCVVNIIHA